MAAFPRSHHDPQNILIAPSPLPGLREHEATPSLFPTRGSDNLIHASKVFPKRVPLYLLKKITNSFSEDRKLGTGSYGKVYKGVHKNGETIAVKLLHSMPGLDDERFEEEFHNLTRLQHKNIVRLVGFCHEVQREFVLHDGKMIFADSKHMALCFEYMHNGSLDKYIFDECSGHDWPTRYAIIKGICEGLKYLHEELNPPIYHLDLKPENILLDDNMMPKLADFGLSKIFEHERTRITKSCIGTRGYLPPEYIDTNVISNKLDIFSLGVIIIKIIAGRTGYTQCAEMSSKQFVEIVHQKWKNRWLQETPADALETYTEQVMGCIEMALSCVETDRHKRPSIGAIIEKLNKMEITTDLGFQDAGGKSEVKNDSTSAGGKEISTQYDLSHNQRNVYSSYHRIFPNPKMKAARDWMQNTCLVGRRLQMDQLRHCTVQAQMNKCQVMSVWGIPGVGKSALVRNLYCDRILENQQFQEYGWVGLSHSRPFNLRDFSRSLLMDFNSESLQAKETAPSNIVGIKGAIGKCRELLSTRRCLVIIDGLQSIQEWDLIHSSLVSRQSESKTVIIVITTEASIATYCAEMEELAFNVKTLEADAAFDLFENEVVSKKRLLSASPSYRESAVLRELISKCGGLPSIIVAMAGILATKPAWMEAAGSINLRFTNEVEMNPEFDSLWDLFSWMHSCFRTCPDSIKQCIFYLSFFPRDHNIRRRRLVRRWIAEGYSRDSGDKSAEENGEEFFSKLLNLSIIQPESSATTAGSDARVVLCRVNGFLRECILSRGMEENLVLELTNARSPSTKSSGRHLVISESWDRDTTVFRRIDFSRLRSMTVFGRWRSYFISGSMRLLQVLDLEDALGLTDADVKEMVKVLPCLKFLSLRGCHGIFHLPSSIGNLRQLQTLDVIDTSIVTLPATITKLQNLQYIRGGTTTISSEDPAAPNASLSWLSKFRRPRRHHLVGVGVPRGIRRLRALHTLGVVNISASSGTAILRELSMHTQLRKLGVCGVNVNNSRAFFSAISCYVHLGSLSVWFDKENRCCLDVCSHRLMPFKNLQSLKLYGLVVGLHFLGNHQLSKLAKLDLEMPTLMEEDITFLGELPKLCILRLFVNRSEDLQLHFCVFINGVEQHSYQKLKVLEIACTSSLHVTFGSETMKNLDLLKIDCCSGSSYQLSGMVHLSQLKEVWLKGSYDETLKQDVEDQLADHPGKPVLKLEEEAPRQ